MKKIWNKFQSLAVAKKLLALSLVMSIVPICCILVLNYQLSGSVVRTQTGELIQANLEQNASNIENFYKGYEKIIQGIYTDEFYTQRLKPINRWDNSERYQAEHEIGERLQELCYNNSGVLGIAIFGTHYDTCFYDTVTQSGQSSFCFDLNKIKNNNTMELIKDERRTIYLPSVCIAQEGYGIYNCMYVVHQLTDFSEYQKGSVGFVILCFDETMLELRGCDGTEISREPFCVAVSIHHRLAKKEKITLDDLAGENLMLMQRGWSYYGDMLRDDMMKNHPEINIIDFNLYNVEAFNRCENNNEVLLAFKSWESVHPLIRIIPVEWDYTMPFGILHSKKPSIKVKRLINAINKVK